MPHLRGRVRDAIVGFLEECGGEASLREIEAALSMRLGTVPSSSVRSSLRLHVSDQVERTQRGRYRLRVSQQDTVSVVTLDPCLERGMAQLYHADCFHWLAQQPDCSIHAVVTDPPYGVVEYSETQLKKLRLGKGGVWRVPPSFDGHRRAPLPRFTTLSVDEKNQLFLFFRKLASHLVRVVVPGANVIVASNPLLSHLVAAAMVEGGLEPRGYLARLTMTMRGGDRPKNAHEEFPDVSVMARSQWEPWLMLRRPLEGRVQDNLRVWGTGGFRRISKDRPFGDVIRSTPTSKAEREIAPHPSLKPQAFMRQVVRASLPLGKGIVYDPFAGSGSTLAAANAVGYRSVGTEADPKFVRLAAHAIEPLSLLETVEPA